MENKVLKKLTCLVCFVILLACSIPLTAQAAPLPEVESHAWPGAANISCIQERTVVPDHSILQFEAHLYGRAGYPIAASLIYIYAPSDVVGIRINDNDIVTGNSTSIAGQVNRLPGSGAYESVTVKITLFYNDKAPYITYATIDPNSWCGISHPLSDHCITSM